MSAGGDRHAYRAWSLYDYYEKLGLDGGMVGLAPDETVILPHPL